MALALLGLQLALYPRILLVCPPQVLMAVQQVLLRLLVPRLSFGDFLLHLYDPFFQGLVLGHRLLHLIYLDSEGVALRDRLFLALDLMLEHLVLQLEVDLKLGDLLLLGTQIALQALDCPLTISQLFLALGDAPVVPHIVLLHVGHELAHPEVQSTLAQADALGKQLFALADLVLHVINLLGVRFSNPMQFFFVTCVVVGHLLPKLLDLEATLLVLFPQQLAVADQLLDLDQKLVLLLLLLQQLLLEEYIGLAQACQVSRKCGSVNRLGDLFEAEDRDWLDFVLLLRLQVSIHL